MSAGVVYVEIDLDASKFTRAQQQTQKDASVVALDQEKNYKNLGMKSEAMYNLMRAQAENAYQGILHSSSTSASDIVRAEEAKNAKLKALNEEQFGTATSFLDSLKSNWLAVSAAIAGVFYGITKAFNLAVAGAQVKSIEDSFKSLSQNAGISGNALIEKLKEVTDQTVVSSDLMKKANRMIIEGFSADQIVQVGEAARMAARVMATDVGSAYDHVTDSIINLRQRGLKTAGFVIDLNDAYQKHAERLNIAKESLNDFGKVMALQEAVEAKRLDMLQKMGPLEESQSERLQQQKSLWTEIWQGIEKANGALWDYITAGQHELELGEALQAHYGVTKAVATPIGVGAGGGVEAGSPYMPGTQSAKEQQNMMEGLEMTKQTLQLRKEMLGVGNQTVQSKVAELEIDKQIAVMALQKFGNTGELIKQTKSLYDAREAFLIQQEHLSNLTDNAEKMAQAEADAEKTRQDVNKTFANWQISYLEKEITAKLKLLQVDTQSQKLEQDRISKLGTAQIQTAVTQGYMRPGQAALQTIGFQQADIAGQISAYEKEKTAMQEILDAAQQQGVTLTDIEAKKGRIRDVDNEIYKLETQSLVLDEQKKQQIAELAPAYEGLAAGFRKYAVETGTFYTQLENMGHDLASGMSDAFSSFFQSIFDNTKSWSDKMKGLFQGLANAFIKSLSEMAAHWLTSQIFGGAGGTGGTGGTGGVGAIGSLAKLLGIGGGGGGATGGIGWSATMANEAGYGQTLSGLYEGGFLAFQHGTDYVPYTGPAILHKGEAVIPANKNKGQGQQASGDSYTIQNYVQVTDPSTFVKIYGGVVKKLSDQSIVEAKRFNRPSMKK